MKDEDAGVDGSLDAEYLGEFADGPVIISLTSEAQNMVIISVGKSKRTLKPFILKVLSVTCKRANQSFWLVRCLTVNAFIISFFLK